MDERAPSKRKMVRQSVMLPEGDHRAIVDLADQRGVPAADLFRRAVSNFVEAQRRTQRRERARGNQ